MVPPLPSPRPHPLNPMHHQLRLHGPRRQLPPRRRRISRHGPLPRRDPRLHSSLRRRLRQHRNPLRSMAWVLDPVAVSASEFRMRACLGLLELRPTVIRGNASEILGLAGAQRIQSSKGADSSHESLDAMDAAKSLALKTGAIVAVSGAVDFITDGSRAVGAHNGVPMMQKITATGCTVTALIAAFVAVVPSNAFEAAACALSIFGLAGELGMDMARGPASLRMHMIDSLYSLNEETVISRVRIASL
ncbi:uncharacterized protein A4U43_C01F7280 [Asparagus officinalis]|uniref:hydroxyethylthiazole kinase n=1 Tax=Asparagus officinalis TaxID=4686 RepID=A0A5P1FRB5_ASPOF|nr:uncharacterized protein A4U43_C01F7280 [Asparagus officinalis]